MKVDVYQSLKNNNIMDNLDKYKGKWCKVNNEEYFLVENLEVDKRRKYGFYILHAKTAFYSRYLYSRKEFELTQRDILEVVDESEVLEQAKKYGHKEIVDMLTKEITKEDLHDCKIWIGDNPELNRQVQEKLFKLGFSWLSGNNSIPALFSYAKGHLLIENGRIITFDFLNSNYFRFNHYNSLKEITPEQILAIKTTESKITSKTDSILQYRNKRSKTKIFQTINLNAIYENSRKSL